MTGPLDRAPRAYRVPFDVVRPEAPYDPDRDRWRAARRADRVAALLETLDGIELGDYDRRIAEHLAGSLDTPELGAVVSWVLRARAADPLPRAGAR